MVDIEAIRVVEDVGDEEPTKKGHLDCHLKANIIEMCLFKTLQELWMLSSVTINCQVTMIDWIQVLNRQNCNRCLKCQVSQTVFQMVKICLNIIKMQKVLKVLKVIKSCLLITLIRCLSDHKFLELFFAWQKWKSVSELVSQSVSDKVTYWAVLDS